jgi:hypothetical protein
MFLLISHPNVVKGRCRFERVDERDAAPPKPGPTKAGAINALCFNEYVVQVDEGLTPAFVIVDGTVSRLGNEAAEFTEIPGLPGIYAAVNTPRFTEEVFRPPGDGARKPMPVLAVFVRGDIAENGILFFATCRVKKDARRLSALFYPGVITGSDECLL